MTNLMFKSMKGLYAVLQCPRCKKVLFSVQAYVDRVTEYRCCEDGEILMRLDIATERVEIEL